MKQNFFVIAISSHLQHLNQEAINLVLIYDHSEWKKYMTLKMLQLMNSEMTQEFLKYTPRSATPTSTLTLETHKSRIEMVVKPGGG